VHLPYARPFCLTEAKGHLLLWGYLVLSAIA
jgi:hypothetical protein